MNEYKTMEERFDERFFNPSIPSPNELKKFFKKEMANNLSSLVREILEKKNLIDMTNGDWSFLEVISVKDILAVAKSRGIGL